MTAPPPATPGTVCHFGTFPSDEAYSRNRACRAHLRASGWRVLDCRAAARLDTTARVRSFRGPSALLHATARQLRGWRELVRRHRSLGRYDVLLVGTPAHADVLLAALLARLRGGALVMDAYYGLHDTVVADRGLLAPRSPLAGLVRLWEWLALHLADRVLIDTEEQARALARSYRVPTERFVALPLGIDEELWRPQPLPPPAPRLRVAAWATFIPLHGLETLLRAAKLLEQRGEPVRIELVGDGQTAASFARLRQELSPGNLEWRRRFVPMSELAAMARDAHCCLGILGRSEKAARVIPTKVVQALASARPVVTADTPAVRRVLREGESALLVPPGDAPALASALARLARDRALCERLAQQGRLVFERELSGAVLEERLHRALLELVRPRRRNGGAPTR